MNDDSKSVREFWINEYTPDKEVFDCVAHTAMNRALKDAIPNKVLNCAVHVIEKSAYDTAIARAEAAERELDFVTKVASETSYDPDSTYRALTSLRAERDALKTELSLAKQDRDSWHRNFKVTSEAANSEIEKLQKRLDFYSIDVAKANRDDVDKWRKMAEEMREVLEFYADDKCWWFTQGAGEVERSEIIASDLSKTEKCKALGGKKARETIKKYDEMAGEK
jgi:hypothetical protein